MILLKLENISKGYGIIQSDSFRPVLKELQFQVNEGDRVAVTGPSGSGKTTILNIAGGLDRPDRGKIFFKNNDLTSFNETELASFRNKEIGFIFQMHHLMPHLNIWENILLPVLPFNKNISKKEKDWAEHLLKYTGIWDQRFQKPSELSGGECQRTAFVRALINKPQLLLADEPTGALDENNAQILSDLLLKLSIDEGVTLIIVTHSDILAGKMDKSYELRNGKLYEG